MSRTYVDFPGTSFPDDTDVLERMSDLEVGDLESAKAYYDLYNSGNLDGANNFLNNNPQLMNKLFNADKFNKLIDIILAMQKFYFDNGFAGADAKSRGNWNNAAQYFVGDNIVHNNKMWQAINNSTNSEPSENNLDWIIALEPPSFADLTWGKLEGRF